MVIYLNQWVNQTGGYESLEEFLTWSDFYDYVSEAFDDDLRAFYNCLENFERRNYPDALTWFKDLSVQDTEELFEDIGGYQLVIKGVKHAKV
jgi:hypothetical protein